MELIMIMAAAAVVVDDDLLSYYKPLQKIFYKLLVYGISIFKIAYDITDSDELINVITV
jgi:hypothetical protein